MKCLALFSMVMVVAVWPASSIAKSKDQRVTVWQESTMMHYRTMTARANGWTSPRWPRSRCAVRCPHMIRELRAQRRSAEHAWNQIRYGTDPMAVRKIIRFWFSRGGHWVLASAMTVANCENGFVASNGPSPTGDWGAWQIHLAAHPDVSEAEADDPWFATMWSWRASNHGTDFSPTWTCATINGIA